VFPPQQYSIIKQGLEKSKAVKIIKKMQSECGYSGSCLRQAQEAEVGGLRVQEQPELHNEFKASLNHTVNLKQKLIQKIGVSFMYFSSERLGSLKFLFRKYFQKVVKNVKIREN
jgi:hypothetical protein